MTSMLIGLCGITYAQQLPADSVEVKVTYKRLWFQERLFMVYVNSYRIINLRQPLIGIGTPRMHKGAFRHSVDMAKTKKFAHYKFDKRSKQYHFRGENIIMGEEGAWSCFTSWRKSKGHRENILDRSFFFTGVGFTRPEIIRTETIDGEEYVTKTTGAMYGTHVFK
jgi:hypothetical protein